MSEVTRRVDRHPRRPGWSSPAAAPLRRVVLGLGAALVGAVASSVFTIVTGFDPSVAAVGVGALVGWFVLAAGPVSRLAAARALAVGLTLLSLVLCEYLLMWFYDGVGFAPMWIPPGEATSLVWEARTLELSALLFWGVGATLAVGAAIGRVSAGHNADAEAREAADIASYVGHRQAAGRVAIKLARRNRRRDRPTRSRRR